MSSDAIWIRSNDASRKCPVCNGDMYHWGYFTGEDGDPQCEEWECQYCSYSVAANNYIPADLPVPYILTTEVLAQITLNTGRGKGE